MSTLSPANITSKAANTPPVIKDLNGTECGQFCRAWVNFNGTGPSASIRDSFNVSSVTDNAIGDYTITFTNAVINSNYCTQISATDDGTGSNMANGYSYGAWKRGPNSVVFTTSSARIQLGYPTNTSLYDQTHIMVTVFGS